MKTARSDDQQERGKAHCRYPILETVPEEAFDDFTRLAAQICETPIALITLSEHNRQWIKSKFGLTGTEAIGKLPFYDYVIQEQDVLVVQDALADERFSTNSLVTSSPGIRFYAGVPLIASQGHVLGTLCTIDYVPRELKYQQLESLQALSRLVITQLELRQNLAESANATQVSQQLKQKLRNRELELLDLFENGPTGLHCLDANGFIVWVNQAELDGLGYSHEEYVGQHIAQFHADKAVATDMLQKLAANETLHNYEARLLCKDGSLRYVLINSNILWEDGQFSHIRCFTHDITEYKRAEQAAQQIAKENLLLARAIAAVSDGVLITNPNQPGNPIVYSNPAFSRITGYQAEEVLGCNCRFMQGSGTDPQTVAQLRTAIEHHQEVQVTLLNYRKDGQPFWNELKIAPAFSNEGDLLYFVGIQTDVTERKQTEQKILEQAALLDIATDAILVQDLDNTLLFWNKGAERLFGWKAEEAIGKNAATLLYREPLPYYQQIQAMLIENGEWQGELHKVTKEGKNVIVESRWTLVRDEASRPKSILVVNTDVTEKKQLEAQFLRAQRMESIGRLAGGIAHDLNNVLAPILMAVQLLELKLLDERSQEWLQILETNAKRGADLVKQVVSFARGIEGDRTLVQVRHLISEIKQIAKETFPKSITVRTDVVQDLWTVSGDATQLHQVLMNLCVNARDAMPEGGTLKISAGNLSIDEHYARLNIEAKVGAYIVVTVSDTGTGIPPEILDRIFEPFFTTKERGRGTGLGLSTAIGIIKSHGGFIHVYSEMGQGTEFKVYLPALEEAETEPVEDPELLAGNGELILVVDDETAIRQITQTSLESYGYRVLTASDGIEAIAQYAQHRNEISVVLVDMMMPSMDGPTTIRMLQKINPEVAIIAVSGLVSSDNVSITMNSGVKMFLSKPYTAKELLKILNGVLKAQS